MFIVCTATVITLFSNYFICSIILSKEGLCSLKKKKQGIHHNIWPGLHTCIVGNDKDTVILLSNKSWVHIFSYSNIFKIKMHLTVHVFKSICHSLIDSFFIFGRAVFFLNSTQNNASLSQWYLRFDELC